MIDADQCEYIRVLISKRKKFRIGTRGIAIECTPMMTYDKWLVTVNRAFMSVYCSGIGVCDDDPDGSVTLECYQGDARSYAVFFVLSEYMTVKEVCKDAA